MVPRQHTGDGDANGNAEIAMTEARNSTAVRCRALETRDIEARPFCQGARSPRRPTSGPQPPADETTTYPRALGGSVSSVAG